MSDTVLRGKRWPFVIIAGVRHSPRSEYCLLMRTGRQPDLLHLPRCVGYSHMVEMDLPDRSRGIVRSRRAYHDVRT